jgi:DNA-binding transcriptional ArsR family regulator
MLDDVKELAMIDDPAVAGISLDPIRGKLLAELTEPGSATTLGAKLGVPRQKLNHHLRTLERHGLIELVEERRKGNCTERVLRATAASYVISPRVLAGMQPDPAIDPDRQSARWLLALAARMVREVGEMLTGATRARKRLATYAMEGEIHFATAADRSAFAAELTTALTALVAKYHDESAPGGRDYRIITAVHPRPGRTEE